MAQPPKVRGRVKQHTDVRFSDRGYMYAQGGKNGRQLGPIGAHTVESRNLLGEVPPGVLIYNLDEGRLELSSGGNKWIPISITDEFLQGDLELGGNVSIGGDLLVKGSSTSIQTETLLIEDNLITLNSSGDEGTYLLGGGIELARGPYPAAVIIWDESSQKWLMGTEGNEGEVVLAGDLSNSLQNFLPLSGGNMLGPLTLSQDPVGENQAATKNYVDNLLSEAAISVENKGSVISQEVTALNFNQALQVLERGPGTVEVNILESDLTQVVFLNGEQTIPGIKSFASGLVSGGDIHTDGIYIKSNEITFNHGVEGPSINDGVISFDRGSDSSALLRWDESADNWKIGVLGSESEVVTRDILLSPAQDIGQSSDRVPTVYADSLNLSSPLPLAQGGTGASDSESARANLGLGSLSTLNSVNNSNWSGTPLALSNGGTGATSASAARTNLGLGSLSTLNSVNNSNWSGTDLSVGNGGTGASNAAGARSNLGAASSGANSDISSLSALTSISSPGNMTITSSNTSTIGANVRFKIQVGGNDKILVDGNDFYPSQNELINLGRADRAFNGINVRDIRNPINKDLRFWVDYNREIHILTNPFGDPTLHFVFGSTGIFTPIGNGTQDLGTPLTRWKDVWATGGIKTFTGNHIYQADTSEELRKGEAVSLVGGLLKRCVSPKDPCCVGIVDSFLPTKAEDIPINSLTDEYIFKDSLDNEVLEGNILVSVSSVGDNYTSENAGFLVCDEGGPISRGDLLCTSSIPGYLMRQDDSLVHSYTVGKSMEDVIFDSNGKSEGVYGFLYCG